MEVTLRANIADPQQWEHLIDEYLQFLSNLILLDYKQIMWVLNVHPRLFNSIHSPVPDMVLLNFLYNLE